MSEGVACFRQRTFDSVLLDAEKLADKPLPFHQHERSGLPVADGGPCAVMNERGLRGAAIVRLSAELPMLEGEDAAFAVNDRSVEAIAHEARNLAARPAADRKALVAAEILRAVYSRLLEKMRLDRWRVFDRRDSLGKLIKLWLGLCGWLGALG